MPFRLKFAALLAAAAVALSCAPPPPPKTTPTPPLPGGYPFSTATFNSVFRWEKGKPVSSRYWISNLGQLIELTNDGKVSFILIRGGIAYTWDAGAKEGDSGPAANGGRVTTDPNALQTLLILPELFRPGNFQFSGYETIEGVRTVQYDVAFKDTRLKTLVAARVWVLPDRLFPVRFRNYGLGGHYEIENSKIVIDPKLPEQLFSPPSDVRFRNVRLDKKK